MTGLKSDTYMSMKGYVICEIHVYSSQQTYPWAKSPQKSWLKDRLLEYNM